MNFNDFQFLTKLSSYVQIAAIVLGFIAVSLQASRFYLDKKINHLKSEFIKNKESETQKIIDSLHTTISFQSQRVELQNQKIESQQNKINDLENKVKNRLLSEIQINKLKLELSNYKGEKIEITSVMGDQEAFSFAVQLNNIFKASGWKVGVVIQTAYRDPIKGMLFIINRETILPKAKNILLLLDSIGFQSEAQLVINTEQETDLILFIGTKN